VLKSEYPKDENVPKSAIVQRNFFSRQFIHPGNLGIGSGSNIGFVPQSHNVKTEVNNSFGCEWDNYAS